MNNTVNIAYNVLITFCVQMLVKRVLNSETQTDVTEEHPPQGVIKTSHREHFLKPVIRCQEQTIRELHMHLDSTSEV
jgi:hypothetical protein